MSETPPDISRSSLSTRLGSLFSASRTPSPTGDMRKLSPLNTATSSLRSSPAGSPKRELFAQPRIDDEPPHFSATLTVPGQPSTRPPRAVDKSPYTSSDDEREQTRADQTAAALRDAMNGEIFDAGQFDPRNYSFQRPQSRSKIHSSLLTPYSIKPPPLLDLARQTTSPSSAIYTLPPLPSDDYIPDPPIIASINNESTLQRQSPPTRTSVDALRSIQTREMHTSATSNITTSGSMPTGWWFQNKNEVDPLLNERDQGDVVEDAVEKIRKRCTFLWEYIVLQLQERRKAIIDMNSSRSRSERGCCSRSWSFRVRFGLGGYCGQ